MSAILNQDPPALPESIAPGLRRIVEHCLEKKPDQRFQSARDLSFALQAPLASGPLAVPINEQSSRPRRPLLLIAGALAIAAISIGASRFFWPAPKEPTWTGTMMGGPEMALNARVS